MTGTPPRSDLPRRLRGLRAEGRLDRARELLAGALASNEGQPLAELSRQHESFWWEPLRGPRVTLVRRGPDDLELIRRCWRDDDFRRQYRRALVPLPEDNAALLALLWDEHYGLVEETHSLHWAIRSGARGLGLVSLVDIDLAQRRAELVIGYTTRATVRQALEAALLAASFAAERAGLGRLSAYFGPDDPRALRAAEQLGFEREGLLRGYEPGSAGGPRVDLVVAGMLIDGPLPARTARFRQRLVGR